MLALIPNKEEFAHAHYVVQGLRQMRPQIIKETLEKCVSIKVKRLFLHFAKKNDLGRGDRKIGTGGSIAKNMKIRLNYCYVGYLYSAQICKSKMFFERRFYNKI